MRFARGDVRGPYRFIQTLSSVFVRALNGDTAAEKSRDRPSRDFSSCSIFDFFNNIGAKQPSKLLNSPTFCSAVIEISSRENRNRQRDLVTVFREAFGVIFFHSLLTVGCVRRR
jgi:hypothetical protein